MKPTDKQLYSHKNSCHPSNTKKPLAYGLCLWIRMICEKEEDSKKQCTSLKSQLRKRGCSGRFIDSQLQKADMLDRTDLWKQSRDRKLEADRVPLVLTYSSLLPKYMTLFSSTRMYYTSLKGWTGILRVHPWSSIEGTKIYVICFYMAKRTGLWLGTLTHVTRDAFTVPEFWNQTYWIHPDR